MMSAQHIESGAPAGAATANGPETHTPETSRFVNDVHQGEPPDRERRKGKEKKKRI